MINLQYHTFKRQSISSTVIFGAALIATFILINYVPSYNYDPGTILDNHDFNMLICIIGPIGLLSVVLSIKPSWYELCKSCNKKVAQLDRLNSADTLEERR